MRVDFHCHSTASDGSLSPSQLASALAGAGVEYAALTDHNTTSGLTSFELTLTQHGIGCLTGVEITSGDPADTLHILAYGFDPENKELQQLLEQHRNHHSPTSADFARIRAWWTRLFQPRVESQLNRYLPEIAEIIRIVHKAGGTAFLAHPWSITKDRQQLSNILDQLKRLGLDGIEVIYSRYNSEQRTTLLSLANRHELLAGGGSDFHGFDQAGINRLSVDISDKVWKSFSEAHGLGPAPGNIYGASAANQSSNPSLARRHPMPPRKPIGYRRRFAVRIVLPTLLATALFILTIYVLILPTLSDNLLQRKREMIKELTNSAWSILAGYEEDAEVGLFSREEAQQRAIERIQQMRYGNEQKDYFWITDMQPMMIMHPYRTDLNGTNVSEFTDMQGTAMFVEFAEVARTQGEGYVEYYWQWKDNPERVVPKESFVKRFEPWDWVIGTGIYIDDVNSEIHALTRKLNKLCFGITACIVLLLAWITWESLRIETQRNHAEYKLRESHEKYAALVAATTEGTLMMLDGQCIYSNPTIAGMLGYATEELAGVGFNSLIDVHTPPENVTWANISSILEGNSTHVQFEGQLIHKSGKAIDSMLSVTRFAIAGQSGVIITARDLSTHHKLEAELGQSRRQLYDLAEGLNIGVFQLKPGTPSSFISLSDATYHIFNIPKSDKPENLNLLEIINDEDEANLISMHLDSGQALRNHVLQFKDKVGRLSVLSLTLIPVKNNTGKVDHFDGSVENVTSQQQADTERDLLLQEYHNSLLFLNEPLVNIAAKLVRCSLHTPVGRAAQMLTRHYVNCLAITAPDSEEVIGVITDNDMRKRVLAVKLDNATPVLSIMSAPVTSLPDHAPVYEALLMMQQQGISHLAVRDSQGQVSGIVDYADLVQFHKYSAAVVTSEIKRASTVDDISQARTRLPQLVQTLIESGARPRNINRMMTRMSDAAVERLINLALEELGHAPCRFSFIALGSEGRGEQTLATDQDSALVLEGKSLSPEAEIYFERFSELITSWLNRAGYRYCPGEMMVSNPKWRMPLATWQTTFQNWITGSTPEDLLKFNIFFDFRCASGDIDLLNQLRDSIRKVISEYPPFMLHLAQNALLYKPPLSITGRIVADHTGHKAQTINIKDAMLAIVNFARLYSLQHNLDQTNTLDRLRKLYELQVLRQSLYEEITMAYSFMMELRLRHQAAQLDAGIEPDNAINPKALNEMQETMLRQSFNMLTLIRRRISQDFLGIVQ